MAERAYRLRRAAQRLSYQRTLREASQGRRSLVSYGDLAAAFNDVFPHLRGPADMPSAEYYELVADAVWKGVQRAANTLMEH